VDAKQGSFMPGQTRWLGSLPKLLYTMKRKCVCRRRIFFPFFVIIFHCHNFALSCFNFEMGFRCPNKGQKKANISDKKGKNRRLQICFEEGDLRGKKMRIFLGLLVSCFWNKQDMACLPLSFWHLSTDTPLAYTLNCIPTYKKHLHIHSQFTYIDPSP
jgi:hypothetical protein